MTTEYFRVRNGLSVGEDTFTVDAATGDVVVGGNLTVNGATTTLNTAELNVEDNKITLNSNVTGTPTLDSGIIVERGTSDNVEIRWNETTDKWQFTNDGTTYSDLGSGAVTSVNGETGVVTLDTNDISEGSTNKYFSNTLARQAFSASTGVTYDNSTGVISIGQDVATTASPTFVDIKPKNIIKGSIRNHPSGLTAGDIYAGYTNLVGTQGILLDNSADTTKRAGIVQRAYNNRTVYLTERANGTVASPAGLSSGSQLWEAISTGYVGGTNSGWIGDKVNNAPAIVRTVAGENWDDGLNKVGARFQVILQPPSTTLTTTSNLLALNMGLDSTIYQSDYYTFKNKSGSNVLTIDNSGNVQITGNTRLLSNIIESSNGNTAITLDDTNVTVSNKLTAQDFVADTIKLTTDYSRQGEYPLFTPLQLWDNKDGDGIQFNMESWRSRGSANSPTPMNNNDEMFVYQAFGHLGTWSGYTGDLGNSNVPQGYAYGNKLIQRNTTNTSTDAINSFAEYGYVRANAQWELETAKHNSITNHQEVTTVILDGSHIKSKKQDASDFFNQINAEIKLTPVKQDGTEINFVFDTNGNITTPNNYVRGNIRNSNTLSNGDVFSFSNGSGGQTRGISIDNSIDTTKRSGVVLRSYGGSLANGNPSSAIIMENARGSASSPSNILVNNSLGGMFVGGYTSSGWISDIGAGTIPALFRFQATENWSNGDANVGTRFQIINQPQATSLTASSGIPTFTSSPEQSIIRSDMITFQNKSGTQTTSINSSGVLSTGNITISGNSIGTSSGDLSINTASNFINVFTNNFNVNRNDTGEAMLYLDKNNGKTGLTVMNQRATASSDFALVNFSTFRSSNGSSYTPTQQGDTIGEFKFNGNAYTGTNPGVPLGPCANIGAYATENWTSTKNGAGFYFRAVKTGTLDSVDVINGNATNLNFNASQVFINDDSYNARVVIDAIKAKFNLPVEFPVYTATQANAITGSVGQQICISNSGGGGNPNGMMAFWDTSNNRWSYIHDNSAV